MSTRARALPATRAARPQRPRLTTDERRNVIDVHFIETRLLNAPANTLVAVMTGDADNSCFDSAHASERQR